MKKDNLIILIFLIFMLVNGYFLIMMYTSILKMEQTKQEFLQQLIKNEDQIQSLRTDLNFCKQEQATHTLTWLSDYGYIGPLLILSVFAIAVISGTIVPLPMDTKRDLCMSANALKHYTSIVEAIEPFFSKGCTYIYNIFWS